MMAIEQHIETLPTVRVMRDDGRGTRIINRADYDPRRHRLVEEPSTEQPATQQAPVVKRRDHQTRYR